jgi:hypothetical protein
MPAKFVIALSFFLIISTGLFAEGNNDGELIFSKSETGRLPNPGEIVQKINDYKKD